MGSSNTTSTSSTAPANQNVTNTLNTLLGGVNSAYNTGAPAFGTAPSAATKQGWSTLLGNAGNNNYNYGINNAILQNNKMVDAAGLSSNQNSAISGANNVAGEYGQMAQDAALGQNAPGYQTVRNQVINDTMKNINSVFNANGRFGGATNQQAAATGLGNALGNLDYGNYQQQIANENNALQGQLGALGSSFNMSQTGTGNVQTAEQMYPGLYSALTAPGQTISGVGSAQDASNQANSQVGRLGSLSQILGVAGPLGGSTSTSTTPTTPAWQSLLGLGVGLL